MSKSAKITIIVSVLALITLIVVLSSTVFAVNSVKMVWYNTPTENFAKLDNNEVLKNSNVSKQSVFILDKQKATNSLEKAYSRMRVLDIEVVWPNVMKVHAIERQQVYAIKLSANKYAICDEYFKILDIKNSFLNTQINEIEVSLPDLKDNSYNIGDSISFEYVSVFTDIYKAYEELKLNLTNAKNLCANIQYTNSKLTINTHYGVTILLDNPTKNTSAKMRLAIKTFDKLGTEDYGKGNIEVFVNQDNKLESRYYL